MQCINCGKNLPEETKYCNNCGKYQPLANTNEKHATRPVFATISVVLLVLGLIPIPLLLIGTIAFLFVGTVFNAGALDIIIHIVKLFLFTSGVPLILALIFKLISK